MTETGNSRKNMMRSVEQSLQRLQTDRIDLLWVHHPDGVTPMDEILRGLDDLVSSGKILHVGLSNFPAWRVARAGLLADVRGWAPVAAVQFEYSLVELDDHLDAASLILTDDQLARLTAVSDIALGAPYAMIAGMQDTLLGGDAGRFDRSAVPVA